MNVEKLQKSSLHPNNKHRKPYDFKSLIQFSKKLESHVFINKYKTTTINFFDPDAVKALNKAILHKHYNIIDWDIPEGYLCPPVPGRADYIHYIADLIFTKKKATILDIGTGANCIYPLIGVKEYGWNFVASEIDDHALRNAKKIITRNKLSESINLKLQSNSKEMFYGIINKDDFFDVTMCNPPFFTSHLEAQKANRRKVKNLSKDKKSNEIKNFGGQNNELWCKGGEKAFIKKMIKESYKFKDHAEWFTVLVSNKNNLKAIGQALHNVNTTESKEIEMKQGQKTSRIVAWKF